MEIEFPVYCKTSLIRCKTISTFILLSNYSQTWKIEESEKEQEEIAPPPNPSHCPQPQIALASLHPNTNKITPPETPPRSHHRPALEEITLPKAPQALTPNRTTTPNPRLHRSYHTPAPARLCHLKHHRDHTHDPPMPDLSLSRSTPPFPSIVNHSLFLPLSL